MKLNIEGFVQSICVVFACSLSSVSFAASSWGVSNEVEARFVGTVVDITCELTGDCPANCGDGKRQLGLKTADQGVVLVAKNLTYYAGAATELVEFCGKEVEVDGLFTENRNVRFFQVQNFCIPGEDGQEATQFQNVWAKQYGGTSGNAKNWYKKDPRIKSIIEKDGYLGLGLDKDKAYFANQ